MKIFYAITNQFPTAPFPPPYPPNDPADPALRDKGGGWGRSIFLFFFLCLVLACSPSPNMKKIVIEKANSSNMKIAIRAEIADSDIERMRGLMFRKAMPEKEGMLFIFDEENLTPFWMKDTYLPLDILFINSQKEIVDIAENAQPLSEELIPPHAPYRYALELNAGFVKKYKVERGDRIEF